MTTLDKVGFVPLRRKQWLGYQWGPEVSATGRGTSSSHLWAWGLGSDFNDGCRPLAWLLPRERNSLFVISYFCYFLGLGLFLLTLCLWVFFFFFQNLPIKPWQVWNLKYIQGVERTCLWCCDSRPMPWCLAIFFFHPVIHDKGTSLLFGGLFWLFKNNHPYPFGGFLLCNWWLCRWELTFIQRQAVT